MDFQVKSTDFVVLIDFQGKLMFSPWILSLTWELIDNFLVLNSKTTQWQQNPGIFGQNLQILHIFLGILQFWADFADVAVFGCFCSFWVDSDLKTAQILRILQFLQILLSWA